MMDQNSYTRQALVSVNCGLITFSNETACSWSAANMTLPILHNLPRCCQHECAMAGIPAASACQIAFFALGLCVPDTWHSFDVTGPHSCRVRMPAQLLSRRPLCHQRRQRGQVLINSNLPHQLAELCVRTSRLISIAVLCLCTWLPMEGHELFVLQHCMLHCVSNVLAFNGKLINARRVI